MRLQLQINHRQLLLDQISILYHRLLKSWIGKENKIFSDSAKHSVEHIDNLILDLKFDLHIVISIPSK